MKFVKVTAGLYRTEEPQGYRITNHPWTIPGLDRSDKDGRKNAKTNPWVISWTTWLGHEKRERYRTLSEAKERIESFQPHVYSKYDYQY